MRQAVLVQSSSPVLDNVERVHACTPVSRVASRCDNDDDRSEPENGSKNATNSTLYGTIAG